METKVNKKRANKVNKVNQNRNNSHQCQNDSEGKKKKNKQILGQHDKLTRVILTEKEETFNAIKNGDEHSQVNKQSKV